jgi:hypothetical protein
VAIDAAHVPREEFVVDAGSIRVHVVGTAFRVVHQQDEVTVAVARGRVRVEAQEQAPRFVEGGQRVVIGTGGAVVAQAALTDVDQEAFLPLGVTVDRPRLSEAPRNDPAPKAAAASSAADPARRKRTQRSKRSTEAPAPNALTAAPARSPEEEFLAWAEDSVRTGACLHYQRGLAEVAEWSLDPRARERARILRARCYDSYRRYLDEYRFGAFAPEAERALRR